MSNEKRVQRLINLSIGLINEEENKEYKELFDSIVNDLDKYDELQRILIKTNKLLWGE